MFCLALQFNRILKMALSAGVGGCSVLIKVGDKGCTGEVWHPIGATISLPYRVVAVVSTMILSRKGWGKHHKMNKCVVGQA